LLGSLRVVLERDVFRSLVSGVSEEVGAFCGRYGWQDVSDCVTDGIRGSSGGFSEPMFELGEEHLDGVEVGRILGKEEELCPDSADCAAHGLSLVGSKIVDDDDVARLERGNENLLDIGKKLSPLIGPSMSHGASMRSWRKAARKVMVCQRP